MAQDPSGVVDNVVDVGNEESYLLGALVASIELPSLKHFQPKYVDRICREEVERHLEAKRSNKNPSGEWMNVEEDTDIPVVEAIEGNASAEGEKESKGEEIKKTMPKESTLQSLATRMSKQVVKSMDLLQKKMIGFISGLARSENELLLLARERNGVIHQEVTRTLKSIVEKAEENEINVASEILFDRFGLDWVLMSGVSVANAYALQNIPGLDEHELEVLSSKHIEDNKECGYGRDMECLYFFRYSQPSSVALQKLMWSLERFARHSILCKLFRGSRVGGNEAQTWRTVISESLFEVHRELTKTDEKRVENTDEALVKCCRDYLVTLRNEKDVALFGIVDFEEQSKNRLPARGVIVPLLIRIVKEITAKMKRPQVVGQLGSSGDTFDLLPLSKTDYIAIYNIAGYQVRVVEKRIRRDFPTIAEDVCAVLSASEADKLNDKWDDGRASVRSKGDFLHPSLAFSQFWEKLWIHMRAIWGNEFLGNCMVKNVKCPWLEIFNELIRAESKATTMFRDFWENAVAADLEEAVCKDSDDEEDEDEEIHVGIDSEIFESTKRALFWNAARFWNKYLAKKASRSRELNAENDSLNGKNPGTVHLTPMSDDSPQRQLRKIKRKKDSKT